MSATTACTLPRVPPLQQWPRGPSNALHRAATNGSIERTLAILSQGLVDINQGEPRGNTPLMLAAGGGHSRVATILVDEGANVSITADDGFTALHISAQGGHLAITKMLMEAGAELDAANSVGVTPLYSAATTGQWEVMRVLIAAGANPDSRVVDGGTPLHIAAQEGHVRATRELLRANARPSLTKTIQASGKVAHAVPLDLAARFQYSGVVRELIRQAGIEGCGGPDSGVTALGMAAINGDKDIMVMLMDAGVVDTGRALLSAVISGHEGHVKFLLQNQKLSTRGEVAYVNCSDPVGATPLLCSITSCSPRVGRVLIDAGADTTSTVRVTSGFGEVVFNDTPLAFTSYTRRNLIAASGATDEKLYRLEATRRLLLQVGAIHAMSWLWPGDISAIAHSAQTSRWTKSASSSLTAMLPIMRRRASRRGVVLAAFYRYSSKN